MNPFIHVIHPYYIQERPVRCIIIINIIVIVAIIIIYYCYWNIVISCPHYSCVWLVSETQQKKKKRLVQLAVLFGWHYQKKSYPVVVRDYDSSLILSFF